jgi:hypothetical protein
MNNITVLLRDFKTNIINESKKKNISTQILSELEK